MTPHMEFETTVNEVFICSRIPHTPDMSIRVYMEDGSYITVSGKDKMVFQWDNQGVEPYNVTKKYIVVEDMRNGKHWIDLPTGQVRDWEKIIDDFDSISDAARKYPDTEVSDDISFMLGDFL